MFAHLVGERGELPRANQFPEPLDVSREHPIPLERSNVLADTIVRQLDPPPASARSAARSANTPNPGSALRTVDQRQSFLGQELDRLQARARERFPARDHGPIQFYVALTHERQRNVSRSPLAPTDPTSGTTGWMPSRRKSSNRCTTSTRHPVLGDPDGEAWQDLQDLTRDVEVSKELFGAYYITSGRKAAAEFAG